MPKGHTLMEHSEFQWFHRATLLNISILPCVTSCTAFTGAFVKGYGKKMGLFSAALPHLLFYHKLPHLHILFGLFQKSKSNCLFWGKIRKKTFENNLKNWNSFFFLVWITINESAFEDWNLPTWALHLNYCHFSANLNKSFKNFFAF